MKQNAYTAETPNVIFVYADDLGRGMLSCFGQRYFETPNIDKICREGLNFTNAHGCHICAPARASLNIGVHDAHCGKWQFTRAGVYHDYLRGALTLEQVYELIHNSGMDENCGNRFLPMVFRDAGYVTGQIGKLEWGFATTGDEIKRHGWDYHYGYYDHAMCHGYYPPVMFENGEAVKIPGNTLVNCGTNQYMKPAYTKNGDDLENGRAVYSQDLFDEKIHEFLCQHRDKPFFLLHPSQLPHGVLSIPELNPAVADRGDLNESEKIYASMVLRLDETVGKIMKDLEELGIADRTMLVFGADNGHCSYYTQQRTGKAVRADKDTGVVFDNLVHRYTSQAVGDIFDGNNGMTGGKSTNFEGGTRVPLMFRWPGHIQPGTSDRLIANYDFMTTMADMLGTDPGEGKDGRSYLGTLLNRWEHDRLQDYVVYASERGPAILDKDGWKLRSYLKDSYHVGLFGNFWNEIRDDVVFELYRVTEDYREEHNLIRQYPERARKMQQMLLRECDGNLIHGTTPPHFAFYGYDYLENDSWKNSAQNLTKSVI